MSQEDNNNFFFKTLQKDLIFDARLTRAILITFLLITLFLRFVFHLDIPFLVIFIFIIWIIFCFFYDRLFKRVKTEERLENVYLLNNLLDVFFLTTIIHFIGGIAWIGGIFYVLIVVTSGLIISKKKAFLLALGSAVAFLILIFLEYHNILAPHNPFDYVVNPYKDLGYILAKYLSLIATLFFLSESVGMFSKRLRSQQQALFKERKKVLRAYQELSEAKTVLEIKVKARTRELEEFTARQEEIIKERTKELQEKIRQLEKLNQIAVGREMKMIELKKEVKRLKELLAEKKIKKLKKTASLSSKQTNKPG